VDLMVQQLKGRQDANRRAGAVGQQQNVRHGSSKGFAAHIIGLGPEGPH
jgi:hypothetical protein